MYKEYLVYLLWEKDLEKCLLQMELEVAHFVFFDRDNDSGQATKMYLPVQKVSETMVRIVSSPVCGPKLKNYHILVYFV